MNGQRLLALFVTLVAAVVVVLVAWLIWFRPPRTVVREQPVVTPPIVASPATPLPRDSIREAKRKQRSRGSKQRNWRRGGSSTRKPPETFARPNKRRSRVRKRSPTARAPARHPRPQRPAQPAQPSNPPSSPPQSEPPPVVSVTPPSACLDQLAHVGDCP